MKRVFAILYEPADYTLDLIRNIYISRNVEWCFIHSSSKASVDDGELTRRPILNEMRFGTRFRFLWRALRTHGAFVVNGWTVRPNLELFFLNWFFFRKPMAWESDTELSVPHQPIKRFIKWLWLGMIFRRRFCYGFAGGEYAHKELFRHYGMSEDRIRLAPMMVDNAKYARKGPPDHGWMTGARPFRFFTLCRLTAIKQVDKVIEAFKLAKLGNAELHVIGTGEDLVAIRKQAKDDPRITVHGAVFGDEKIKLMHKMDCMVLYSSFEPWGLVVNEALSAGIPCIVSDKVGAKTDLVDGKADGLIVNSKISGELAAAMQQICSDLKWYDMASRNAVSVMLHWDYELYECGFEIFIR